MNRKFLGIAGFVVFALAGNAIAHHSHAYYVPEGELVLEGTVTEFDWRNPHSWVTIAVADDTSGEMQEWSFEARSPASLGTRGWTSDSFVPGDVISITYRPLVNGGPGGLLREATLADGTVLLDR